MHSSKLRNEDSGIALVITLAILVIATIVVVGFTSSMRTERQASASIASGEAANLIAQSAIDHAISILDQNIPQPVPSNTSTANPKNWIVNPGLLMIIQGTAAPVQIPLSSNPSATYISTSQDAELNVPKLSGSGYTILPPPITPATAPPMKVAWSALLKDPSTAAGVSNPITGRYAFWMDDESAKINLNTAYGKPAGMDFTKLTPGVITVGSASYPLGHPSSVNLEVLNLPSNIIDPAALATAVSNQGGFSSIDELKACVSNGSPEAFLNSNRFNLTAYSRDPEFNVFGKSRLYLFRRLIDSSSGATLQRIGQPLFQIFRDLDAPMYFHGDEASSADTAAPYYTASNIAGLLNRNDWPGMPARSFIEKWGGAPPGTPNSGKTPAQLAADREADQFAWNMVSMGSFSDYNTGYTSSTSGDYVKF